MPSINNFARLVKENPTLEAVRWLSLKMPATSPARSPGAPYAPIAYGVFYFCGAWDNLFSRVADLSKRQERG